MADFKAITTQEEFDERIRERIERAEKKAREEFKGWISPDDMKLINDKHTSEVQKLNEAHAKEMEKYAGYDEKFNSQASEIHDLKIREMKTKVAIEKKLPIDAVEFLKGDDEEAITASADKLSKLSVNQFNGFTRNTETSASNPKDDALRKMLAQIE